MWRAGPPLWAAQHTLSRPAEGLEERTPPSLPSLKARRPDGERPGPQLP